MIYEYESQHNTSYATFLTGKDGQVDDNNIPAFIYSRGSGTLNIPCTLACVTCLRRCHLIPFRNRHPSPLMPFPLPSVTILRPYPLALAPIPYPLPQPTVLYPPCPLPEIPYPVLPTLSFCSLYNVDDTLLPMQY